MSEPHANGLYLKGFLQIATAHEALEMSGANPKAQELFRCMLRLHEVTAVSDEDPSPILVFIDDQNTRHDVIESLGRLSQSPDAQGDCKEAALGLLELLQSAT